MLPTKNFIFNVKIMNSNSKRSYITNNNNSKKAKDIFIHKKDIYLIKLLEKRIQLTKILKANKPNIKQIKMINPFIYQYQHNKCKSYLNFDKNNNKLKYSNKNSENNSYINHKTDMNNTLIKFDDLITSKIYNKDNSKNNQNLLKLISEDKKNNINLINTKIYFENKNINTLGNSLLNETKNFYNKKLELPKIKKNIINKITRNKRNIINNEYSYRNFKTIILKRKNNFNYDNEVTSSDRRNSKDNNNINNKINYKIIFDKNSISPINNLKHNLL